MTKDRITALLLSATLALGGGMVACDREDRADVREGVKDAEETAEDVGKDVEEAVDEADTDGKDD
jgi:hypothetical protein